MITPRFRLNQTSDTITITIRAPYCSLKTCEIIVEETMFIFLCSPYYLRLNLPGKIVENDCSNGQFNADTGEFQLTFDKEQKGEHFPDLELITKLLCPKLEVDDPTGTNEKITVLTNGENVVQDISNDDVQNDFGFALAGRNKFTNVIFSEFHEVFEVNPCETLLEDRRKLRLHDEKVKFSIDHYLCDLIENEEILEIISLESQWRKSAKIEFTDKELDFLKDLPHVQFTLSEEQQRICHCCLIDILYGYCYDRRTTYFEGSSESGWTMIKLAATFSWLDAFKESKEALISSYRRSLIYPLYRNFELNKKIFEDLKDIFKLGKMMIIRCLIEMYYTFVDSECCRYIINNLFIKDYIVYVMKMDKEQFALILNDLNKINVCKSDLGLNLSELENSIVNSDEDELENFAKLQIKDDDSDDD